MRFYPKGLLMFLPLVPLKSREELQSHDQDLIENPLVNLAENEDEHVNTET
jgi:hypothetical protein